ncbi:MAG TPA: hypothetical protein DCS93_06470 [Microscillaceae bacterium]|nr:hypothetical protein [Microscillaceae bacterium]
MNWRIIYYIYEGLAILIILLVSWLWWSEPTIDSGNYWSSYNASLEQSVQRATLVAHQADSTLRANVKDQGHSREGLDRIQRTGLLQKRTNRVIALLENAKKQLKNLPSNTRRSTSRLLIDQAMAYRIKDSLDSYVDWLNDDFKDLIEFKFEPLAHHDPSQDWYYPWESIMDFPKRYYRYTLPAEAVTILSVQQTKITHYEEELLARLVGGSMDAYCGFDKEEPGVFVPLRTIEVGNTYTADMFIGASASKYYTRMTYNGRPITVKDGKGEVLFTVQQKAKKYWKAGFTYRKRSNSQDTTIRYTMPFEVLPK